MRSRVTGLLVMLTAFATRGMAADDLELSEQKIVNWPVASYWSRPILVEVDEDSLGKAGIPSPPLPFVAVQPCRVADTRGNGAPIQGGAFSGPADVRNWTISGVCGIPSGVEAVSVNFTAVGPAAAGFLVAWPMGGAPPPVSTLNFNAGETVANAAIVPLGSGAMTVNVSAATHVILDVNGYFGGAVTEVQQRVSGTCPSGSSIRAVSANGTVTCETDDNTTYTAGFGLSLSSGVFSLNTAVSDGRYWSTIGNSGTLSGNFLGTTDAQPLQLRASDSRRLRLQGDGGVIGGGDENRITAGAVFGTIAGGGGDSAGDENVVSESSSTIGGGLRNLISDGTGSTDAGAFSTIGGGADNVVNGASGTIAGGSGNRAGNWGAVGGGRDNVSTGRDSMIPGGAENAASGIGAFAAGQRAKALHTGAFVWSDYVAFDFPSTGMHQFSVRSTGGARFVSAVDGLGAPTFGVQLAAGGNAWAPLSDRAAKANFCDVDEEALLERLAAVPIETWNLKSQDPSIRHIGPMAQDFAAAFGVGEDDRHITTSNADGVAFAAIQALYAKLQAKERELAEQSLRLVDLERRLAALERGRLEE